MDLLIIYRALVKKLWIIFSAPVLAVIVAFFLTADLPKLYRSDAQLSTGFTVEKHVTLTNDKFNIYAVELNFNNLIERLNSNTVRSLVSYKLLLHDLMADQPFRKITDPKDLQKIAAIDRDQLIALLNAKYDSAKVLNSTDEFERKVSEILKIYKFHSDWVKSVTAVKRVKRTDYVSILAITDNPHLSSYVSNQLCEAFFKYNSRVETSSTGESVELFEKLVSQKRKELEEKSYQLQQYKSTNRLLDLDAESSAKIEQLAVYEQTQEAEQRQLSTIRNEINDIDRRISALSGGTVVSDQTVRNDKSEIMDLRNKIHDMNQLGNVNSNPELKDSLNRMRTLLVTLTNSQPVATTGAVTSGMSVEQLKERKRQLELDYGKVEIHLKSTQEYIRSLGNQLGDYASKEARITNLEREVEFARDEYTSAQEKYSRALDISLNTGNSIKQIIFAQPATDPEPSKRLVISGLAGVSTFMMCIIIIAFLEYIDVSIKTPSNFKKVLKEVKLLGALCSVKLEKGKNPLDIGNGKKVNGTESKSGNKGFKLFRKSEANNFNQLRKIRYEIEHSGKRIFLFTSAQQGVGKSTAIVSLAKSLSLTGYKVLIVDANFTNNTLTKLYKAAPVVSRKLGELLGDIPKHIKKTDAKGVDILGCQSGNFSPTEIFMKKETDFFNELKEYDYIFVEGASLNDFSDSKELAENVDSLVAVFSAKTSIRQNDLDSIGFLNEQEGKFTGAILNQVEPENLDK